MIGAALIALAILVAAYVLYVVNTQARPSEVVYVTEERWDPWGWRRPMHPLGPGGQRRLIGPGGERRLFGAAHRG